VAASRVEATTARALALRGRAHVGRREGARVGARGRRRERASAEREVTRDGCWCDQQSKAERKSEGREVGLSEPGS